MNGRNVHRLMLRSFPQERPAPWVYFCDCSGRNEQPAIKAFIGEHFQAEKLLVEVHRSIGGFLPHSEAAVLIAAHICKADIRVSDRAFSTFAVFARNGVVSSWRNAVQQGAQADEPASGGSAA
jgi:hypothetical protein